MSQADPLPQLLLAVPAVVLACKAGAQLFRRLGQPPVIGEIVVGIMFGPSLLGWLWPAAQHALLPASVLPFITQFGNIGLLIFMFLVGLELDTSTLRGHSRTAVAVSQASILLPLTLGSLLALGMFPTLAPHGVSRLPFVLYIAVSMSITAFPVLARILTDKGLYHTRIGTLTMACAAVDDVTAWCLLALVVAVADSGSTTGVLMTAGLAAAFLALMVCVARPLIARWTDRATRVDSVVMVLLFSGLCLSALATDRIGVHALFGAFLFGAIVPRGSGAIERSAARLRAFAQPVLLPLFFISTGLSTDIRLLAGRPSDLLWGLAVLAVAVVGKWGGSSLAARAAGQGWRDALSIGALMNSRGLTELVVLNLGLQQGVIGPELYTMLVLMALVTTALTSPALSLLRRRESEEPLPTLSDDLREPVADSRQPAPA